MTSETKILIQRGAPKGDAPRVRGGYVLSVRCTLGHSGNQRFAIDGRWAECQGCGTHVAAADLAQRQREEIVQEATR